MTTHLLDPTPIFDHLERRGTTSNRRAAVVLGVSSRQVERWRAGQQMRLVTADRLAVSLGVHPGNIWPEWWTA